MDLPNFRNKQEIINYALLYNITIPNQLTKNKMLLFLEEKLTDREKISNLLPHQLMIETVPTIKAYAKFHNYDIKHCRTKENLIERIKELAFSKEKEKIKKKREYKKEEDLFYKQREEKSMQRFKDVTCPSCKKWAYGYNHNIQNCCCNSVKNTRCDNYSYLGDSNTEIDSLTGSIYDIETDLDRIELVSMKNDKVISFLLERVEMLERKLENMVEEYSSNNKT
jgi:hypothetical protein